MCTRTVLVHERRMCQTGNCTLAGAWGDNNKENWDWNNNSSNSSSNSACQCMLQRRVRRRHPATIQTPGREEVGDVQLEPLVSSFSSRLAWEPPAAFHSTAGAAAAAAPSYRAGGGFFRDQNQNLAPPPQQQQAPSSSSTFDSKSGSSSSTDYLIWRAIDASKYQRFDVFEETSRGWPSASASSKFV